MKLRTLSGNSLVSSTHEPGLGSGTSLVGTGNHIDVLEACSLNLPTNNTKNFKFKFYRWIILKYNLPSSNT